ncbi:MAG: hypothetical protein NVSMB19_06060 [Vulcanimicrobiaceae bacterium]
MSLLRIAAFTASISLALGACGVARAQAPSPSPAPRATYAAAADERAGRVHLAIVTCDPAPFYSWPDHNIVPSGSSYPPGRVGDAFHVVGDGTLATNGMTLYETTIDVVAPYGYGKHYYISAFCVNAG